MKRLTLLSGGEKSMTAIAFLFSVFLAKPCPFYILDEVEAALDDLNISRFLDLLEMYRDHAQFIVVTHQKRTMEAADTLYGVSMGADGVSKVVSRKLPRDAAPADRRLTRLVSSGMMPATVRPLHHRAPAPAAPTATTPREPRRTARPSAAACSGGCGRTSQDPRGAERRSVDPVRDGRRGDGAPEEAPSTWAPTADVVSSWRPRRRRRPGGRGAHRAARGAAGRHRPPRRGASTCARPR